MKRITFAVVISTLAAVLAAPHHAAAFDQPGCPGIDDPTYQGSESCRFLFEGFPVTVYGLAYTSRAPVRVWVTPDGYPQVVLLECSGAGRCDDDLHAEGNLEQIPQQIPKLRLRCYVEGQGRGEYFCGSGKNPPPQP